MLFFLSKSEENKQGQLIAIITIIICLHPSNLFTLDDEQGQLTLWSEEGKQGQLIATVTCHNFKSQKNKLSVSNPKSKYVAYLSVLSQISNCQGLGRKNKHEILKTDRMPDSAMILLRSNMLRTD